MRRSENPPPDSVQHGRDLICIRPPRHRLQQAAVLLLRPARPARRRERREGSRSAAAASASPAGGDAPPPCPRPGRSDPRFRQRQQPRRHCAQSPAIGYLETPTRPGPPGVTPAPAAPARAAPGDPARPRPPRRRPATLPRPFPAAAGGIAPPGSADTIVDICRSRASPARISTEPGGGSSSVLRKQLADSVVQVVGVVDDHAPCPGRARL